MREAELEDSFELEILISIYTHIEIVNLLRLFKNYVNLQCLLLNMLIYLNKQYTSKYFKCLLFKTCIKKPLFNTQYQIIKLLNKFEVGIKAFSKYF